MWLLILKYKKAGTVHYEFREEHVALAFVAQEKEHIEDYTLLPPCGTCTMEQWGKDDENCPECDAYLA